MFEFYDPSRLTPIGTYLEAYELIRDFKGPESARRMIEAHADHDPDFFVYARREGRLVGLAVCWRISDPEDVFDHLGYPGEEDAEEARYVYWPLVYVHPDHRDLDVLYELVLQTARQYAGVRRIAFLKRDQMHIWPLAVLLKRIELRRLGRIDDAGRNRERIGQAVLGVQPERPAAAGPTNGTGGSLGEVRLPEPADRGAGLGGPPDEAGPSQAQKAF